ncbi:homeobox protein knotted-1-like 3 [Dendrobium catenatum]|uniref:Homeobox protein knotted-1-like 3 n=1 Tax=Dendrobium catenatum TaxID=906689 RepID=A0A2I0W4V5_9ASPA|nr:homeobox protein knotted-1-like 3 [Dendrobium catenatum]PKU70696.1 Homeobox protein knotted-1-like 3 [Dendrobium catenatum]
MAYHRHHAQELTIPQYSENRLAENPAAIPSIASELIGRTTSNVAGKTPRTIAGGPTWLNGAILRQQSQQFGDGSFLHLQTASDSSTSPVAAGQWVPHRLFNGEEEVPVSSDSMIAAVMPDPVAIDGETVAGGGRGQQAVEGTWQNARHKAEILGHPLCEQLLSAHVACLRIATPVDQLPRIDAQLAQLQQVVAKYSALGAQHGGQILTCDDKELDHFLVRQFSFFF